MSEATSKVKDNAAAYDNAARSAGQACKLAALRYLSKGLSALALCPPDHVGVGKDHVKQCKSPGKVPIGSWKDQQTTLLRPEQLKHKWDVNPLLNVGIALGGVTRIIGIDIEGKDSEAALAKLSRGDLPPTWEFTSGNGRRLLYRAPDDVQLKTTPEPGGLKIADGEVRLMGTGSQTVMPPSRHRNGKTYAWVPGHSPDEIELAPLPQWAVRVMADNTQSNGRAQSKPLDDAEVITGGHRNTALTSLAGSLRRRGAIEREIFAALRAFNERCEPRLDDTELQTIAHSMMKYKPEDPILNDVVHSNDESAAPWTEPLSFDVQLTVPAFPTALLPPWFSDYIGGVAHATQTPPDLAAMLAIAHAGAAIAGKFRIQIRKGWVEPTNIYTVTAAESGERKSAVYNAIMEPAHRHQREQQKEAVPRIAAAKAEYAMLEARVKQLAATAAKQTDEMERQRLTHELKQSARELAAHAVPEDPKLITDDVSAEELTQLLVKQGGRMFLSAPEGTAFEIAKGRYSDSPNFDVYLKGHAGDPLCSDRVSRGRQAVESPALSIALAVQPDVIRGLADEATMRTRGFLARFLFSMPQSLVGSRTIGTAAVGDDVRAAYEENMLRLWRIPGSVDESGAPVASWLHFSPAADATMREFEHWLEPRLKRGGELSQLAGWANKLAGAIARMAGILHMICAAEGGTRAPARIEPETVETAIQIGRDYLLPHALAAFALMEMDERLAKARHVWESIEGRSEYSECSESAPVSFTRRDIHQWNRRQFVSVKDLDPIIQILIDRGFLRLIEDSGAKGRGHASPAYLVNPLVTPNLKA
jgi:hypothetical protein